MQDIPRPSPEKPDWSTPEVRRVDAGLYYESQRWIGKLYREVQLPGVHSSADPRNSLRRAASQLQPITLEEALRYIQDDTSRAPLARVVKDKIDELATPLSAGTRLRAEVQRILSLYNRYTQALRIICFTFSLTRTELDEAEVVIGTIAEKTSQPRMRKDRMSQMREQTTQLAGDIAAALSAAAPREDGEREDIQTYQKNLRIAGIAHDLSTMRPQSFGARSFGLIALGEVFDAIRKIEELQARSDAA